MRFAVDLDHPKAERSALSSERYAFALALPNQRSTIGTLLIAAASIRSRNSAE